MTKIFETIAGEYLPQDIIPPPKAYEPCPEYGLQFNSPEERDKASEIIRAHLLEVFPDLTPDELVPFSKHPATLMRTTRTCFFEQRLPPFERVSLEGVK